MENNSTIRLQLTGMAAGGEAFGRHEGKIIFVPYAIAGEEIRAQIIEERKGFARARIVEIVTPSPARITPRCPHFTPLLPRGGALVPEVLDPSNEVKGTKRSGRDRGGGCGGCQWQHIAYPAQLEFKTQIVREQFARIAKMADAPVAPVIPAREEWHYRNHAQFALNERGELSFRAYESHTLIPIRECHILASPLTEMFNALELEGADYDAVDLRAGINTGEKMIVFESADANPPEIEIDEPVSIAFQVGDVVVPLIGNTKLREVLRARRFEYSPNAFFQVNTPMAEVLIDLVREFLAPHGEDVLLDAYAGVGIFGLSLAPEVARVVMIEEDSSALADARANAKELTNAEFYAGRVENVLPRLDARFDLAVLDPPRAGLDARVIDALIKSSPRSIAYVSCDPTTLARDARRLVDGGYRLEKVQPVDLFPQTYHIECVARFVHM